MPNFVMKEVLDCDRLTQLKCLLEVLSEAIDAKPGARDLAQLCKQYRETSAEIAEMEGGHEQDEISAILDRRKADGKSDTIR